MARQAKPKNVTYRGNGRSSLRPRVYEIAYSGKTYRLPEGEPKEVPNAVALKLKQVRGHEFDIKPLEGGND